MTTDHLGVAFQLFDRILAPPACAFPWLLLLARRVAAPARPLTLIALSIPAVFVATLAGETLPSPSTTVPYLFVGFARFALIAAAFAVSLRASSRLNGLQALGIGALGSLAGDLTRIALLLIITALPLWGAA